MGKMRAIHLYWKTTREECDKLRFYRGFIRRAVARSCTAKPFCSLVFGLNTF